MTTLIRQAEKADIDVEMKRVPVTLPPKAAAPQVHRVKLSKTNFTLLLLCVRQHLTPRQQAWALLVFKRTPRYVVGMERSHGYRQHPRSLQ